MIIEPLKEEIKILSFVPTHYRSTWTNIWCYSVDEIMPFHWNISFCSRFTWNFPSVNGWIRNKKRNFSRTIVVQVSFLSRIVVSTDVLNFSLIDQRQLTSWCSLFNVNQRRTILVVLCVIYRSDSDWTNPFFFFRFPDQYVSIHRVRLSSALYKSLFIILIIDRFSFIDW